MTFGHRLLNWFDKHQRPLPWRKKYLPYEVWVSEIMLQQTQVETALPYFERWMKAFPTIESLAKSDEKKVLKLWQGLGYYSRARNLLETAQRVVKDFGGQFPSNYETIHSLKGIGPYSAGAIASIAFNQERPIVDGNVLRVLTRVYAIDTPIDDLKNRDQFWQLQESLIPKGQARFFNQALMELGALICSSSNPQCDRCPIQKFCKAYQEKTVDLYPVRKKRKKTVKVEASAVILEDDGRYLIQKRPLGKIMGGLWEFPEWKLARDKKLSLKEIKNKTLKNLQCQSGIKRFDLKYRAVIKRNYTHHLESLHVFDAHPDKRGHVKYLTCPRLSDKKWLCVWATKKEFQKYPFSSAHAKIAELIQG